MLVKWIVLETGLGYLRSVHQSNEPRIFFFLHFSRTSHSLRKFHHNFSKACYCLEVWEVRNVSCLLLLVYTCVCFFTVLLILLNYIYKVSFERPINLQPIKIFSKQMHGNTFSRLNCVKITIDGCKIMPQMIIFQLESVDLFW